MVRVSCESEDARREVLASLAPQYSIRDCELPPNTPGHETAMWMVEQLQLAARAEPREVVSFRGFEAALREDPRDAIVDLNFQRESYKEAGAHQIWWLSRAFTGLMLQRAPDLDSWFDGKLFLSSTGPLDELSDIL